MLMMMMTMATLQLSSIFYAEKWRHTQTHTDTHIHTHTHTHTQTHRRKNSDTVMVRLTGV